MMSVEELSALLWGTIVVGWIGFIIISISLVFDAVSAFRSRSSKTADTSLSGEERL